MKNYHVNRIALHIETELDYQKKKKREMGLEIFLSHLEREESDFSVVFFWTAKCRLCDPNSLMVQILTNLFQGTLIEFIKI